MGHPFPVQCEALLLTDARALWSLFVLLHNVAADEQLDDAEETGQEYDQDDDGYEDGSDCFYSVRRGSPRDGQDENQKTNNLQDKCFSNQRNLEKTHHQSNVPDFLHISFVDDDHCVGCLETGDPDGKLAIKSRQ